MPRASGTMAPAFATLTWKPTISGVAPTGGVAERCDSAGHARHTSCPFQVSRQAPLPGSFGSCASASTVICWPQRHADPAAIMMAGTAASNAPSVTGIAFRGWRGSAKQGDVRYTVSQCAALPLTRIDGIVAPGVTSSAIATTDLILTLHAIREPSPNSLSQHEAGGHGDPGWQAHGDVADLGRVDAPIVLGDHIV